MQGIAGDAKLLGGDALDVLNLPLHWRRKPLATSALVGTIALLFAAGARRSRRARREGRGSSSSLLLPLLRGFLGTSLAGAMAGRLGRAIGWIHD